MNDSSDLSTLERLHAARHPAPDPRDFCRIDPPGEDDSFANCVYCSAPGYQPCEHDFDPDLYPWVSEVIYVSR